MNYSFNSDFSTEGYLLDVNHLSSSSAQYIDRIVPPNETVRRASWSFEQLGITRIADQTGLDRIGIPCFAAFRPNSKTLANSQGKGVSREAARASAVMEAVEHSIAENQYIPTLLGNIKELSERGQTLVDIRHLLPIGETIPDNKNLKWVKGYNLASQDAVLIPFDAVNIDGKDTDLIGICKSTNGLASGNCEEEAIFHGLCELIERDAGSLWSLKSKEIQALTAIDPTTWKDKTVVELFQKVENAGLSMKLFDHTSDIGMPCVMAVIGEIGKDEYQHFDLAAGYGAHPISSRAAIRAITEAAQTRITSIAGSRDDIDPDTYSEIATLEHIELLEVKATPNRSMSKGMPIRTSLSELLNYTMLALRKAGIEDVFAFPLCGDEFDFSVMKLVVLPLEDREANSNWRPNIRALEVMLAA